jgi:V-type H+-transporting ATPase subunit A
VTLETAALIKEDFLRQNGYSESDKCCPFYKTVGMMKNFCLFYELAKRAVTWDKDERRFTWSTIAEQLAEHINALSALKFLNPQSGKENVSIIILIDIKNKRKQ